LKTEDKFWIFQLHIHLDGSFRHSTLFELAEKKGNTK
jgi:adenosine deaminase